MGKKIVFVENADSFITKSIIGNLESMGLECMKVKWSVDEISANKDDFSDIVIAYIDDLSEIDPNAFVCLEDVCSTGNHGMYLAGRKDDIEEVKSTYGLATVVGEFYRPINAKDVAAQIGSKVSDNPVNRRKHILVVDDSGVMLNTIQEWLGEKYRVSVVNSAMNALAFLDQSIPDLILLDYEMPVTSGAQLLEMLRADTKTDSIPVIFLTGKEDPESVKKVLALKPEGYLLKNMPKDYIIKQVDDFFAKTNVN